MDTKKLVYKNISGLPQTVIGYGIVQPNGTIETEIPFENPNFELVTGKKMIGKDPVTKMPNKE